MRDIGLAGQHKIIGSVAATPTTMPLCDGRGGRSKRSVPNDIMSCTGGFGRKVMRFWLQKCGFFMDKGQKASKKNLIKPKITKDH